MSRKARRVGYSLDTRGIEILSQEETAAILRGADDLIMSGGRSLLSKILQGSRDQKVLERGLDQSPVYGYYNHLTQADILAHIDWVITNGFLDIEYDYRLPLLVYTPAGWEIEKETYANELLAGFDRLIERGAPFDMEYLKDRDRGLILLLLDKVAASNNPKYIPLLEAWAQIDYKKVKARIGQVISELQSIVKYTEQNRRAWDEIAAVRHQASFPPATFFAQGGSLLAEVVIQAAGDVKGKQLLHLQCSTGAETLSWAVAGANATGVDISPAQIEIARSLAAEAGLTVRFVAADVYHLPPELLKGEFDLVHTGGGSLVWLPELTRWAKTVAAALRPGGRLILFETHPLAGCLEATEAGLKIVDDYFRRGQAVMDTGWCHFEGGEAAQEGKYEFNWPLGDVITALVQAGLTVERLQEYPSNERWRFGDQLEQVARLPGEYLLVARK
jgi:SAM-dependent methyltransferase